MKTYRMAPDIRDHYCAFNAYAGGTDTERGHKARGLRSITLPEVKLSHFATDNLCANFVSDSEPVVRWTFACLKDALDFIDALKTSSRIEVRSAVPYYVPEEGGYTFFAYQYFLYIRSASIQSIQSDIYGNTLPAPAAVDFRVDHYTLRIDDKARLDVLPDYSHLCGIPNRGDTL